MFKLRLLPTLIMVLLALSTEIPRASAGPFSLTSLKQAKGKPPSPPTKLGTARGDPKTLEKKNAQLSQLKISNSRILMQFFGFYDLQTPEAILLGLAITIVSTRSIPMNDIIFSIAYPIYIGLINRIRFQRNQAYLETKNPKIQQPINLLWQPRERTGTWFIKYLNTFGIIGILMPLILLFSTPMSISAPAVPHTYLVLMQVVTEGLSRGSQMHVLPKLLIPIGFNAYRMASLWSWFKLSGKMVEDTYVIRHNPLKKRYQAMIVCGFFLGVTNFIVWAYNLFIFLLLRVTPQFLDTDTFPTVQVSWKRQIWPVYSSQESIKKG